MNFDWTAEEEKLKQQVANLFDEETRAEIDVLQRAEVPEIKALTEGFLMKLAETGYLDIQPGLDRGGSFMALTAAQEQLAKVSSSLYLSVETSTRLFGRILKEHGNQPEHEELLKQLAQGRLIGAVAVSEPDPDDPAAPSEPTHAIPDGDDYVLTGLKSFVTNGPIADLIAVIANIHDKQAAFLVKPGMTGLSMGDRLKTMGYDGLTVAPIELKEVRAPKDMMLGPFKDEHAVYGLKGIQDFIMTMASVGMMHRIVDWAKKYTQSHERGGKSVYKYQEIRFKFADMHTLYQTSQLLAYRAAWLYESGDPEAETVMKCAKVFSAEAGEKTASLAMQAVASGGYIGDNPVQRAYRDAMFSAIVGTTSETARMIVADTQLEKYRV